MDKRSSELVDKGLKALQQGEILVALVQLEAALETAPLPQVKSSLAFCLASERRQFQRSQALCQQALAAEPANPEHYYQLGRIYLLAKQRQRAIQTFRKGLKYKRHQPIIDELHRLGIRRTPPFAFLERDHFLNRSAGKLLARLGRR